jgi:hypothetical protein
VANSYLTSSEFEKEITSADLTKMMLSELSYRIIPNQSLTLVAISASSLGAKQIIALNVRKKGVGVANTTEVK